MTSSSAGHPAPTAGLVNLANGLTVLRLFLVPVFVACLAAGASGTDAASWRVAAFGVFAVASVTDLLDGELARRRGLITDFGKIADPIADKALTGSALITLSALGELSWWVTWVILFREVGVTVLRFWVLRHGVIAASRGGKVKTMIQMVAIGLYILPIDLGWVRAAIMAAAVAVTLLTGADYVARALRLRRAARRHPIAMVATTRSASDKAGQELNAQAAAHAQQEPSPSPRPSLGGVDDAGLAGHAGLAGQDLPPGQEGPTGPVQPAVGAPGDAGQTE